MNKSFIALLCLVSLMILSLSRHQIDSKIQKVLLKNNVQFSAGGITGVADFHKLNDSDELKIDSDLARFHISRISDIFMSENGQYIMTFAKDIENKMKRVIFIFEKGRMTPFADDVIEIKKGLIRTSKGSVSVADGSNIIAN